jgi:hypothetical protein
MKTALIEKKLLPLLLFFFCTQTFGTNEFAEDADGQVFKSLFVYNFIKNIQWPAQPSRIEIGIAGEDESAFIAFDKMAKAKSKEGQEIVVKKFEEEDSTLPEVIYIPSAVSGDKTRSLIDKVRTKSTVLITERSDWVHKGAFISFKVIDNKLRFQINKEVFEKTGIKISSSLVSMAI